MQIWGNAARYRGSLEELDQEEISPDESQGSSTVKVRDMAEKLKSQADRDRRRQIQRQQAGGGRGGMYRVFQNKRFPIYDLAKIFRQCFPP